MLKSRFCKSRSFLSFIFLICIASHAITLDSLKEKLLEPFDFLPDYYLRFDMSTFALHQNEFQKRNFLAEPHPELEFCFLSYKDLVTSVWNVDFQFGLGQVPGDVVFTVLNVAFGIEPTIEVRLKKWTLDFGLAHRCIHEVDRSEFPIVYYNRTFLGGASKNYRLNDYWGRLYNDSAYTFKNRFAWSAEGSYYLRDFFGLTSPNKLNGSNSNVWDASVSLRYSIYKRKSWIFVATSQSTLGMFDPTDGFFPSGSVNWYGMQSLGLKAFFSRGKRGACAFVDYHLDKLPVPLNQPLFTQGKSRFSKDGMLQIGITFFN